MSGEAGLEVVLERRPRRRGDMVDTNGGCRRSDRRQWKRYASHEAFRQAVYPRILNQLSEPRLVQLDGFPVAKLCSFPVEGLGQTCVNRLPGQLGLIAMRNVTFVPQIVSATVAPNRSSSIRPASGLSCSRMSRPTR